MFIQTCLVAMLTWNGLIQSMPTTMGVVDETTTGPASTPINTPASVILSVGLHVTTDMSPGSANLVVKQPPRMATNGETEGLKIIPQPSRQEEVAPLPPGGIIQPPRPMESAPPSIPSTTERIVIKSLSDPIARSIPSEVQFDLPKILAVVTSKESSEESN